MKKRILSAVLAISMILSFAGAAPIPTQPFNAGNRSTHEHSFACYENYDLICNENHEHIESCFEHSGELVCGIDEGMEHTHNEEGYECHVVEKVLICTTQEHTHSEECYSEEEVPLAKVELPETGFTEEFYTSEGEGTIDDATKSDLPDISSMDGELSENEADELPEITSTDEETSTEKTLTCELTEHVHDETCYSEVWECRKLVTDDKTIEDTEDAEDYESPGEVADSLQETPELPPAFSFGIDSVDENARNDDKNTEIPTQMDHDIVDIIASFTKIANDLLERIDYNRICTSDELEELKKLFDELVSFKNEIPEEYFLLGSDYYTELHDAELKFKEVGNWVKFNILNSEVMVDTDEYDFVVCLDSSKVRMVGASSNGYDEDCHNVSFNIDLEKNPQGRVNVWLEDKSEYVIHYTSQKVGEKYMLYYSNYTTYEASFLPVGKLFTIKDYDGNPVSGAKVVINGVTLISNSNGDVSLSSSDCDEITFIPDKDSLFKGEFRSVKTMDIIYGGYKYKFNDLFQPIIYVADDSPDRTPQSLIKEYLDSLTTLYNEISLIGYNDSLFNSEKPQRIRDRYDEMLHIKNRIPEKWFLPGSDYYTELHDAEHKFKEVDNWVKFNTLNNKSSVETNGYDYVFYTEDPNVKMAGTADNSYGELCRDVIFNIDLEKNPQDSVYIRLMDTSDYVIRYQSQKIGDKYKLCYSNYNTGSVECSFLPIGKLFTIKDCDGDPVSGAEVLINGVTLISNSNGDVYTRKDDCDKITFKPDSKNSYYWEIKNVPTVEIKYADKEYVFNKLFPPVIYIESPEVTFDTINKQTQKPVSGIIFEYTVDGMKKQAKSTAGEIKFFASDLKNLRYGEEALDLTITGAKNYNGEVVLFSSPITNYRIHKNKNGDFMLYNQEIEAFTDVIEIDENLLSGILKPRNSITIKFNVVRDSVVSFEGRYNLNTDGTMTDGTSYSGGQGNSYKKIIKQTQIKPQYFSKTKIMFYSYILDYSDYGNLNFNIYSSVRGKIPKGSLSTVYYDLNDYYIMDIEDGEEITFWREDGRTPFIGVHGCRSMHSITTSGMLSDKIGSYENHLDSFQLSKKVNNKYNITYSGVSASSATDLLDVYAIPIAGDVKFTVNGTNKYTDKYCIIQGKDGEILEKRPLTGKSMILDNLVWDETYAPYTAYITDVFGNKISDETLIRYRFHTTSKWDALDGYWLSLDTLTVTEPETTSFKVDKIWKNTTYAELPDKITLQLGYTSGSNQWTEWGEPVVLNKDDFGISPIWNYEWTGLSKLVDNKPVSWSVKEIKIGEQNAEADGTFSDYSVEYSDVTTTNSCFQQTITNTHTVEYTDELPSTGGRGVWYMYCIGVLCIGCVAAFWVYQRKKKQ